MDLQDLELNHVMTPKRDLINVFYSRKKLRVLRVHYVDNFFHPLVLEALPESIERMKVSQHPNLVCDESLRMLGKHPNIKLL
mmetsp:Transcript_16274/g.41898  ORF Transcript_16274/g.41898 Transcript_16274/m.41898 type:complete len:82 (-) Transcript_16274:520-765(-)